MTNKPVHQRTSSGERETSPPILERVGRHLERINFGAYVDLLQRPMRLFLLNFFAGMARGFGVAVGMTLVFAIVAYVFAQTMPRVFSIPILGQFIAQIVNAVQSYMPETTSAPLPPLNP